MSDRVRFGLVGAGGIAQTYAQAFERSTNARLVAVADVRPEAARALAHGLNCRAYESHGAMAEGSLLDAVVVCTPPSSHEAVCTDLVRRGLHVLCEKPFTVDAAGAARMVEAAHSAGVHLTMASKFRHVDDVIRAKAILVSGILGEVILFENAFTARVNMSGRWNADPAVSGGGVLIDNGTHSVDLIRYFLGPIAEVHVVEGKRVQDLPVEDTARVFVRTAGGVMGSIDLSWSINKELDSYINIYGSHGTISVGWRESKYRQSTSHDWVVFGKGYDKVQAFRHQIDNFALTLRGEESLLVTPEDALASVEVIEAAYASLREEHWTTIAHAGRNGTCHPPARPLAGGCR